MHRGIPATRHGIREQLANLTLESPVEYMLCNLGLSLTDHYWVCPGEKRFTWEEINLYTNDFQSRYSLDLSDDERSIAGKTNFVPSGSLKGDLKKKWIIDERGIRRPITMEIPADRACVRCLRLKYTEDRANLNIRHMS